MEITMGEVLYLVLVIAVAWWAYGMLKEFFYGVTPAATSRPAADRPSSSSSNVSVMMRATSFGSSCRSAAWQKVHETAASPNVSRDLRPWRS